MKRLQMPSTLTLGVAVLLAVLVVSALSWGLGAAARPSDYRQRMAAVNRTLSEIERAGPQKPSAYGATTLCRTSALAAAGALRARLAQQSTAAGLTARQLAVTAGSGGGYPRLTAIDVSYAAEGPYDGVRRMLGSLGAGGPEVFIDQFEIKPAGDKTTVKIKGRAFCWISARP
ncbi:GspMb/PilO family protein [Caulobacter mirabilis]|uniref:General secretion pathway protein GspM n=1 Tax=Caulobacter mirabilis TaxID=69666 RepID=A0A2D2AZS3_9CAUL|nr:GspMb/PilO family protein [Caulobacter mirabilis]ATQ43427.1 hypothetical protein CSW64_13895 [Caulobacter mirabilis]